jgi:mono/diheme cytochrome c family protein
MLRPTIRTRTGVGVAALALVAALLAPSALAHRSATPKLVGNAKAGKAVFISTCSACHTLKAAGAVGQIGPNLDKVSLPEATIVKAITNGGSTVMTKAQIAKYSTQMTPYKGVLSPAVINNIAAFVYSSTHK